MKADVDLPWYLGSGPATARGDAGLRSSHGALLGAGGGSLDAAELAMAHRIGVGRHLAEVEERLAQLDPRTVLVLTTHYGQRSPAYGVSAAVVLCPGWTWEGPARPHLTRLYREDRARFVALEAESHRLVTEARRAYEATAVTRRSRAYEEAEP